jgi:hypothetical protein
LLNDDRNMVSGRPSGKPPMAERLLLR